VDLAQGIGSTVAVLKGKAREKSASIAVELPEGLPRVLGHAGELNQVWANLIHNAIDAVPASGRVEVSAWREGRNVIVTVVDDGHGIPDEIRDRIFDPFFTTKPVGQGTGLGLDIVRRLVRMNDGDIQVESRPGRTEFRVSLTAVGPATSGAPA
jgi:signal transduction histidine kinase